MRLKAFVPTAELDRSVAFYEHVLGLELVERDDDGAHLRSGDTLVRVTKSPPFELHAFTVLGWQVDDLAAEVAPLADAGVGFERYAGMEQDELGVWTAPGGDRIAWFKDPDGNLLSLDQPA